MDRELDQVHKRGVFKIVETPDHEEILPLTWTFAPSSMIWAS